MSAQCFSCRHVNPDRTITSQGECRRKGCKRYGKLVGMMAVHACPEWELASMDMLRGRTKRKISFTADGTVMLE